MVSNSKQLKNIQPFIWSKTLSLSYLQNCLGWPQFGIATISLIDTWIYFIIQKSLEPKGKECNRRRGKWAVSIPSVQRRVRKQRKSQWWWYPVPCRAWQWPQSASHTVESASLQTNTISNINSDQESSFNVFL